MQKFLPIFPLSLVAYPHEKINLHIFEPKYKQMIKECVDEKKTFGIPVVNKNEILEYGTEMEVLQVEKTYAEGEMDIKVKGISTFRVLDVVKEIPEKLYWGAIISVIENITDHHSKTRLQLENLSGKLFELLDIKKNIIKDGFTFESYQIAHFVGFNLLEEYELLKHPRESTRQKIIVEHIKKILPAVKQMTDIKEKAKLNGHFKMIHPPDIF